MTAVEQLIDQLTSIGVLEIPKGSNAVTYIIQQAKEMEREQRIDFAKMHVKIALKAVENEMILQALSVKHWYLPQNIK